MVICGNRQPWEADERTSTNNLDAALLRWMLSTWAHKNTSWTTVDISTAFLTVKMPVDQLVLLRPRGVLIKMGLAKEDELWIATKAVYGLRSAPHGVKALPGPSDAKNSKSRKYSLCKSLLSPSIWYRLPCGLQEQKKTDKKIKNDQRSDEQVCKRLPMHPVGCIGIFVDDIICAAPQDVSDALMLWIKSKYTTGLRTESGSCFDKKRYTGTSSRNSVDQSVGVCCRSLG
eukprot:2789154-Amphidinium_carterae.3